MSRKVGGLWAKKKDGKSYLAGSIEVVAGIPVKIAVFKNEKKEAGSKQPDYNIVVSQPGEQAKKNFDKPSSSNYPKETDLGEF